MSRRRPITSGDVFFALQPDVRRSSRTTASVTAELRTLLEHVGRQSFADRFYLAGGAGGDVASVLGIGLMKLDAINSRGSRKDFYDLFFILRSLTLEHLLEHGRLKYEHARDFEVMAIGTLVAFDNADRDREPDMLADAAAAEAMRTSVADH